VIQQWAIALAAACDPNPDNYITEEDARQLKQVKEQREKHETNQEFGWIQNQREPNPDRRPASRPFQSTAVKSFPADHQGGHMSTTVGSKRPRSPRSSTIGSTAERTGADGAVLHISNLEISKGEDMWAWHNESPHVPTSRSFILFVHAAHHLILISFPDISLISHFLLQERQLGMIIRSASSTPLSIDWGATRQLSKARPKT